MKMGEKVKWKLKVFGWKKKKYGEWWRDEWK